VNSQSNRYWYAENYMFIHEVPLHDVMVGVWCAISASGIIWTIIFWQHKFTSILHTSWHHFLNTRPITRKPIFFLPRGYKSSYRNSLPVFLITGKQRGIVAFSYTRFEPVRVLLMTHVKRTKCTHKDNSPSTENSLKQGIQGKVPSIPSKKTPTCKEQRVC
jgi:hypothetical protein